MTPNAPPRMELWVNKYPDSLITAHLSKESALYCANSNSKQKPTRLAVHMIEERMIPTEHNEMQIALLKSGLLVTEIEIEAIGGLLADPQAGPVVFHLVARKLVAFATAAKMKARIAEMEAKP